MSDPAAPLLARLESEGASAQVDLPPPAQAASPEDLADRLSHAAALQSGDPAAALAAWDEAGRLHDPASLDAVIVRLVPTGLLGGLLPGRRRLLRSARATLAATSAPGTAVLAAAILGVVGDSRDVSQLEQLASHPALVLHGATALAALAGRTPDACRSLLRLMAGSEGEQKLVVIDRLFLFLGEPAVRYALIVDGVRGLSDQDARALARDLHEILDLESLAAKEKAEPTVREAARRLLALVG